MSTKNRRPSLVDRNTLLSSSGNHGKFIPPHLARKRPPLGNLTNQNNFVSRNVARCSAAASGNTVQCSGKVAKAKKESSTCKGRTGISGNAWPAISKVKSIGVSKGDKPSETASSSSTRHAPCSTAFSPSPSVTVSLDETMSTCDSFKSPEVEYLDNMDVSEAVSLERKALSTLCISGQVGTAGKMINEGVQVMEADKKTVNVDDNFSDPQFCATIACDIYKHLRASEVKKRPSTDFMETIQKDINPSMRGILIDWLVEVAEEYRLVPDTLFLTVNYIDRYLSGNPMDRQRLQLLGVACMMIASKYEEICAPQVEEFCYITDNTYFRDEVLQMESMVLNYLKFEMTAPTIKCFLRRFIRAAQVSGEGPSLQLECLANYIAELSLIEYTMLRYAPSLIAAAAIFLAKCIFFPSKRPWNATLQHYTHYQPGDLYECVVGLHQLFCNSHRSTLPAVREKYSQHKYKFVAKKHCPPSIPLEFFCNEGTA